MGNVPLGEKLISLLGFLCGIEWILIGLTISFKPILLILGMIILITSIGLFFSWNMAKIAAVFLSYIFILIYFYLIYLYIRGSFHYSWGVALVGYFPVFLWSFLIIILKNKKEKR